jgi:tetratricopeptide (TPR) repeat protein
VRNGLKPVKDKGEKPALYLPLWAGDELFGVAVLIGAKSHVLELSSGHLQDRSRAVSRELHLLKRGAVDPLTRLGNSLVLQARLNVLGEREDLAGALVLFDLYPKAADAGKAGNAVARVAASLQALIGHLGFPCHLGNGLFGLCWEGASEETAARMAEQVLQWLKRDSLSRGHAGIVACGAAGGRDDLDRAWKALGTARKRGPFGLCAYETLADRSAHPLYPPSGKTVRSLRKLMKDCASFGLVELQPDYTGVVFSEELLAELPGVAVTSDGRNGYVFLTGMDEKGVLAWCRQAQSFFADRDLSFSMGISIYPFAEFRTGEIIGNCRKALLHTAFFGPGTSTVFDGVSLNISGDVYYNEGDMVKAAREYQRGLKIDPENVNLLNSMGVTMAQMARYPKATPYFEQVLEVDPRDFMALCNLGFAHVAMGNLDRAVKAFEEGLCCDDVHFELLFQLGKIYTSQARYHDAVQVLERAEGMGPENIEDVSHGAVHRFLGEAYSHENNTKKGMVSLQRAIRYNSQDAQSLSLLGELYAKGGEGLDIGLTFCQQAVDIDPDCWVYWLRLGRLHLEAGQLDEAQDVLRQLLPLQDKDLDISLFQARLYDAQCKDAKACAVFRQILRQDGKNKEAKKAVKRLEKGKK